jgi:putative transposase
MSHSYNKIWLHIVFSTKDRLPMIHTEIESQLYNHIKAQLNEQGCVVSIINGMPEHIHLLFLLNPQKAVADIVKQLKGYSSHWVNENDLTKEKFAWQVGYSAFSVSESQLEKVYKYILNQKEHHKKKTFAEEYEEFIKLHNLYDSER